MYKSLSTLLREKVDILELRRGETGYTWEPLRTVWAGVEEDTRRNLFSEVGIGARGATVTLRPLTGFTLANALRWKGEFLFLTAVIPSENRDRLTVKAARCTPVLCRGDLDRTQPGPNFPGILTEKYLGHDQLNPLAVVTGDMVLVTPKAISLAPGSWVEAAGEIYQVLLCHQLDPFKNEYEIRRKEDC